MSVASAMFAQVQLLLIFVCVCMCSLCSLLFYIYEHLTTLLHICGWCLPLHAKLGRAEVYSVGVSFNLLRIHCACTHGSSWMRPIAKAQNDSTECEALHPSCDGLNRMHLLNSCMHALESRTFLLFRLGSFWQCIVWEFVCIMRSSLDSALFQHASFFAPVSCSGYVVWGKNPALL